jgi:hypothetical protein
MPYGAGSYTMGPKSTVKKGKKPTKKPMSFGFGKK